MKQRWIATLVFVVTLSTSSVSAQRSNALSDTVNALEGLATELATLSTDLLGYQKALPSGIDREIAGQLWDISDLASLYVDATQTSMSLMALMQDAEQRQRAQRVINPRTKYYAGRLDEHVALSNTLVASSRSPAVVAAGNRLVAHLRKIKALLQTIGG